ncbi:MAG: hypothetical protein ABJC60_00370 [Actinomycetota bacterium]
MSSPSHRQSLLLPILIPLGGLAVIGAVLFGFSRILLAISHNAATVTACVVAIAIMVMATLVSRRPSVGAPAIGSMVGVVAGVALVTGALAFLIVGPQKEAVEGVPELLAAGPKASTEGFDESTLSFPADTPVALEFDNQETGIQHNVAIFTQDPAEVTGQTPLFSGAFITGPARDTYNVQPLAAGTYFYHCDVHPGTMMGQITVATGGASAGASTSPGAETSATP